MLFHLALAVRGDPGSSVEDVVLGDESIKVSIDEFLPKNLDSEGVKVRKPGFFVL